MLVGRQWDVWSDLLGQFVDVTRYMSDEERIWRQRPVVNMLQYWFMLTHARLTENPPVVAFQPATADRSDAMLAEAMDTIFKTVWTEIGMDDVVVRFMAWIAAAGESYLYSRADLSRGDMKPLMGRATLSMQGQDGQTITRQTSEPVPYDKQGNPLAQLSEDGESYDITGEAHQQREGELRVDVLSPLEIRSQWGTAIQWEDKAWMIHRAYLTVGDVSTQYGVEVKADTYGSSLAGGSPGYLQRMLLGNGMFGSVMSRPEGTGIGSNGEGYVTVDTMWERPSDLYPQTEGNPGGRLLVVTPTTVLHDSVRPYACDGAGPIRRGRFIDLPGRPSGSTPLEQMIPVQKTYNRGWAQLLEHRNLCTNPILVVDESQDIEGQITNKPGQMITANFAAAGGKIPAAYLTPPTLSGDVYKVQAMLLDQIMRLGSIAGAEGAPQTDDPSGELVSQLRYNSDRFISPATRSAVTALAGMAKDWVSILPTLWTTEKIITYAGDDSVVRTMTVLPEMWEGDVHVKPDINSMRPESQGEKQARLYSWFQGSVFGDPINDPAARAQFLELANFPDMNRASRPGGVDAVTAQQNLGKLVRGASSAEIPLYPWYNLGVFKQVTRDFMAAPEYLSLDPNMQNEFVHYWEMIEAATIAQAAQQMQQQAPLMTAQAAMQGTMASAAQAHSPPPEVTGDNEGKPGQSGPPSHSTSPKNPGSSKSTNGARAA